MDWDRIKAKDLFILFNNFKPPQGNVISVKIYPSEFGMQRLKEEEVRGPAELTARPLGQNEKDLAETREGSKYHMETLRQYQLNRLRYYYAIIECDSPETANALYTELDGMEYESSASQLDLRFIPDDIVFEQEPSSTCDKLPDMSNYKPALFITKALQQTMVELTWDETDPDRMRNFEKAFDKEEDGPAADLSAYLASSSSEEEEIQDKIKNKDEGHKKESAKSQVAKYKELLASIDENEKKKKDDDIQMEITWEPGLKERTENLIKVKQQKEEMSYFDKYLETKRENKKQLRKARKEAKLSENNADTENDSLLQNDDDVPSDVDLNDPYFQEELKSIKGQKPRKNKKRKPKEEEMVTDVKAKGELELLLMDDDNKSHFDLKNLIEDAATSRKKKKKNMGKEQKKRKADEFQIDLKDDRFSALFINADFNVDPSDTHFKKTKAMETLVQEKIKRRSEMVPKNAVSTGEDANIVKKDPMLSLLVKSVKSKTKNFIKKKR